LDGQKWITLEELGRGHGNVFLTEEPGVHSIFTEPAFGIGERAFLICTSAGNVLWDCIALIDQPSIDAIRRMGGIDAIAISHPHYYTTMIEWSNAFGNAPIHIHKSDQAWVMRPHENVRFWLGETLNLLDGLTLIHTPGHFDGFQVLHWRDGVGGKGTLFSADQPQVCMDRRWLSFMYSYPNLIPLDPESVQNIVRILEPWSFDRIYGAFPKRTVASEGKDSPPATQAKSEYLFVRQIWGASHAPLLSRRGTEGSKGKSGGTAHTSAQRSEGLQRSEGWGMTCLREEAVPP
jgi:hypothetical protein